MNILSEFAFVVNYDADNGLTTILSKFENVSKVSKDVDDFYNKISKTQIVMSDTSSMKAFSQGMGFVDDSFSLFLENTDYSEKSLSNYEKYLQSTTKATSTFGKSLKSLGANLLSIGTNMALLAGITLALKGVYTVVDNYIHRIEKARDKAQDAAESWKAIQSEITSLNEELETTTVRIDELNSKDNLTIMEQEELEKLKETNTELERNIALQGALEDVANKEASGKAKDYFDKNDSYTQYTGYNTSRVETGQDRYGTNMYKTFSGSTLEVLKQRIQEYSIITARKKELDKEIAELKIASPNTYEASDQFHSMSSELSAITAQIEHIKPAIVSGVDGINKLDDSLSKTTDTKYISAINDINDSFSRLFDSENYSQKKFDEIWKSSAFEKYKDKLVDLASSGEITPKVLESNRNYQRLMENTGLTAKQVAEHINAMSKETDEAAQSSYKLSSSITDWKAALDTENEGKAYDELTKGLEEAKKMFNEGLVGTDDFKSYAKMLSPTGADDAKNFAENYKKAMRYLEDANASGVQNFLIDLSKNTDEAGEAFASFDKKTNQWSVNIGDIDKTAKALGIGSEVVEAAMKRLSDYGFDINWIDSLDIGVEKIAEYYREISELEVNDTIEPKVKSEQIDILNDKISNTLSLMDDLAQKDAIDYSAEIDSATASIEAYYKQIQNIMDGGVDLGGNESKVVSKMYSEMQQMASEHGIELKADLKIDPTAVNEYLTNAGEKTIVTVDDGEATTMLKGVTDLIGDISAGVVDLGTKIIGDLGADSAKEKLQSVIDKLDTIRIKAALPITQKVNVLRSESGAAKLNGTIPSLSARALALGSLNTGQAYSSGDGKTKSDERALVGEVGQELVVSGNRWWTVGDDHVEFADIPKGSIVFNAEQTKKLLSQGYAPGRGGTAYLSGTAYSVGGVGSFSGGATKYNSKTSAHSTKSTKDQTKELDKQAKQYDWIETALDRISRQRDNIADIVDDENVSYQKQLSTLQELLALDEQVIATNSAALSNYNAQWEEIRKKIVETFGEATGNEFIGKIVNGDVSLEKWRDSIDQNSEAGAAQAELIDDAKNVYSSLIGQEDTYNEALKKRTEDQQKQFEIRVNMIKSYLDEVESEMSDAEADLSIKETTGRMITEADYKNMINLSRDQIDLYYDQIDALEEQLDTLDEGSAEWYNTKSQIASCSNAIRQCEQDQADWNEEILNLPIRRIERYLELLGNIKKDIQNSISEQDVLGVNATKEQLQSLIDISAKQIDKLKEQHDTLTGKLGNYEYGSDKFNEVHKELQDVEDEISSLIQSQREWNKEILNIPVNNIGKLNGQMQNIKDALTGVTDTYDTAISAVTNAIDKQVGSLNDLKDATTKAYEAKIKPYQDELDLLNKANEARRIQLGLEQSQYALDKANNQKTNQVVRNGEVVYEADKDAQRDANQGHQDTLLEKKKYDLQTQIDSLGEERDKLLEGYDSQIEKLDKIKEKWSQIASDIEAAKNAAVADDIFGKGWMDKILSGTDGDIYEMLKNNYENVESQKDMYEKQIEVNEKISALMSQYIEAYQNGTMTFDQVIGKFDELVASAKDGFSAMENLDAILGVTGDKDAGSAFENLQNGISSSYSDFKEYLKTVQINNDVFDKYTATWEEIKNAVVEQLALLKKQAEEEAKRVANSKPSSGGGKGSSSGSSGPDWSTPDNVATGPGKESELKATADRTKAKKYKSGIENGLIGENTNSTADAISAIALEPLKPDELLTVLHRGEGVFNPDQMSMLMQNLSQLPVITPTFATPKIPEFINTPPKETPREFSFNMRDINLNSVDNTRELVEEIELNFESALRQEFSKY